MITDHDIATKKRPPANFLSGRQHSKPEIDAFERLCQHVISHLPDSIDNRREVLDALIVCAPRDSALAQRIRELQWHLQAHLRLSDAFSSRQIHIRFSKESGQ
jgi:hypothetical protein